MSSILIFYPIFAQVFLTFILLYLTGRTRLALIRRKEVRVRDIAIGQNAWPERVTRIANSYNSQFQLPVLFYAVSIMAQITGQIDMVMIVLAWGFVTLRFIHAGIYVTTNNVSHRFYAFVAGFIVLVIMWVHFAYTLIQAGGY